jgi:hypothetical protein
MITMKVRNKDMCDAASPDFIAVHLDLGTLTAINEAGKFIQGQHL